MFDRLLKANSKLFNVLLAVSAAGSMVSFVVLYFLPLSPYTFFVWVFLALPALLLFWAPPLLFLLVVYWLVSRPFARLPRPGRRLIGLLLTLVLVIAVPQWVKHHFEAQARDLVSGDNRNRPLPLKADILALVAAPQSDAKVSSLRGCGDFCLRVLLNDIADGVALFTTQVLPEAPHPSSRGKLYRLVQQEDCPEIRISEARWLKVSGEDRRSRIRNKDLVQRVAAQGLCIVMTEITLSEADVIISDGLVKERPENSEVGFSLFADTMSARRTQLHVRSNGILHETYRTTAVTAQLPATPLLFAFNMDEAGNGGMRLKPGFLRTETSLSGYGKLNLSVFLTNTLGLDLQLPETNQT